MKTTTDSMTKGEKEQLVRLIRARAKMAKSRAAERSARLRADFEQQLDARYPYDRNETWQQAYAAAEKAVKEANALVAEECQKLGIPERFAPRLAMAWQMRGENQIKDRRNELRKLADTQIAAIEKAACSEIEQRSLEAQTELVATGLSEAAKGFLEQLPPVEALMPALEVTKVEAMLEDRPGRRV